MNTIFVFCVFLFISLSIAAPTIEDAQARTLAYKNDNDGLGNYEFSFETSNGITRRESGRLVNAGLPDEHIVVQGSYSYYNAEGKQVVVNYTADENGYQTDVGPQLPGLQPVIPAIPIAGAPPALVASLLG